MLLLLLLKLRSRLLLLLLRLLLRLESHVVHLIHGAGLGNVDPVVHWRNHILVDKVAPGPHPIGVVKVVWNIAGAGIWNKVIIVAIVWWSSIEVAGKVCAHPKGVHGIIGASIGTSITSVVG